MTRVKICAIGRVEDALVAAEAGADFVGLVFVPNRRRRLEVEAAKAIVDGLRAANMDAPNVVGIFADQPLDEVNAVIQACGLDLVQLCGSEFLDYCGQVEAEVIKVVHVTTTVDETREDVIANLTRRVGDYRNAGHLVTLDRMVDGLQGGTGQGFDWNIAAQLSESGHSFLLAGGLTPDNVGQAIAQVHPWGVDVSSGVETDGIKDLDKIRAFVQNAKAGLS